MYDIRTGQVEDTKIVRFGEDDDPAVFIKGEVDRDDEDEPYVVALVDISHNQELELPDRQFAERLMKALEYALENDFWEE